MSRWAAAILGTTAAMGLALACVPARQAGEDGSATGETGQDRDRGARRSTADRPPPDLGAGDGASSTADAGGAEGSDGGDAGGAMPPAEPPPGKLLAKAPLADLGELRIEEIGDGVALRLRAGADKTVSIEPLVRLQGPGKAGLYVGPGCQSVSAGSEKVVGIWTGEQARCATEPQPLAVLVGRGAPSGCPVEPAPRGTWTLSVFACGRYSEPVATVTFDLPSVRGRGGDGGAAL